MDLIISGLILIMPLVAAGVNSVFSSDGFPYIDGDEGKNKDLIRLGRLFLFYITISIFLELIRLLISGATLSSLFTSFTTSKSKNPLLTPLYIVTTPVRWLAYIIFPTSTLDFWIKFIAIYTLAIMIASVTAFKNSPWTSVCILVVGFVTTLMFYIIKIYSTDVGCKKASVFSD